jgi:hypothetical protein
MATDAVQGSLDMMRGGDMPGHSGEAAAIAAFLCANHWAHAISLNSELD